MCRLNRRYILVVLRPSHGKVEFLALDDPGICQYTVSRSTGTCSLCVVDVKEVGVQDSLDNTCNDRDWVVESRHIEEVTVDPVRNVQCPVRAQRK